MAVARKEPDRLTSKADLTNVLARIGPGQVAVSHLNCDWFVTTALRKFKVVVLQREVRTTFISHIRFLADTGRRPVSTQQWASLPDSPEKTLRALQDFGAIHLTMCRAMLGWCTAPGILRLSFEGLNGDRGPEAASAAVIRLAAFCGIPNIDANRAAEVLAKVLRRPTQTWSGQRTDIAAFWDDRVEHEFRQMGGDAINRAFGYALAPWDGRTTRVPSALPIHWSRVDRLRMETHTLWQAAKDRRVPWYARAVAGFALAYFWSPIDLIPDWIPVIGYMDDAMVVPLAIVVFRMLAPAGVLREHRLVAAQRLERRRGSLVTPPISA
jgi:uncharacterized membrane protein YkvA (DUF1232 family)